MLTHAVGPQSAEQLTQDVMLPRQQLERLPGVLPLAVTQDALEEMDDPLVLGLALFAELTPRGA
jgi:hypothetical protein